MDPALEMIISFLNENLSKKEIKEILKEYPKEEIKKILRLLNK